jgi:hypothetical protein
MAGEAFPEISPEDAYQEGVLELGVVTDELPDLGPSLDLTEEALPSEPITVFALPDHLQAPPPPLPADWSDESETLLEFTRGPVAASDEPTTAIHSMAAAAMEDHSDFDPDSFLDQEPGPEPTPAFLPELPEPPGQAHAATPVHVPPLSEHSGIPDLSGLDPIVESAGRDTVPPWATTVSLLDRVHPTPEPAPMPPPALEPEPVHEPAPAHPAALELEPVHEPSPAHPAALELEPVHEPSPAHPAALELEPVHEPASVPVPSAALAAPADPLAALLADPVLLDRLAKAVAARLGDQTLREIAWEVMPEMADRLNRN